jgi:hypothetical protein
MQYQSQQGYNLSLDFEAIAPITRESDSSISKLQAEIESTRQNTKISSKWGIFGPICTAFRCTQPVKTNESFLGSLSGSEVCQKTGYQTGKVLSNSVGCWNFGDRRVARTIGFNQACKLQYHPYAYYRANSRMCVEN